MSLHPKYTDYTIISKNHISEFLKHILYPNKEIEIYYYASGQIKAEWWCLNGKWHREDGPAIIEYYESGKIESEQWFLNGMFHREDGPAIINYYKSGKTLYFFLNDKKYTYDEFIQTSEYQVYLKQTSIDVFD